MKCIGIIELVMEHFAYQVFIECLLKAFAFNFTCESYPGACRLKTNDTSILPYPLQLHPPITHHSVDQQWFSQKIIQTNKNNNMSFQIHIKFWEKRFHRKFSVHKKIWACCYYLVLGWMILQKLFCPSDFSFLFVRKR